MISAICEIIPLTHYPSKKHREVAYKTPESIVHTTAVRVIINKVRAMESVSSGYLTTFGMKLIGGL